MNKRSSESSVINIVKAAALAAAFAAVLILAGLNMKTVRADQMEVNFSSTDGSACQALHDGSYFSDNIEYFDPGTQITITAGQAIDSLYIMWAYEPTEWTLRINGNDYTYGKNGYLHEFVEIPANEKGATSVTLVIGSSRLTIAEIYAFSAGPLPSFVQKWEPSYDEADVLFLSTHADDEVLFFGGIIPILIDQNVRVQVAYFTDLAMSEPYRQNEQLNGLWTMGVTHYPQFGEFYDYYSESYEGAAAQYSYDDSLEYVVRIIRRFKPQVVVGQDIINGEYGHGGHLWSSKMIADAIEITNDAASYPQTAAKYGTWDVAKTYFHLYPENKIEYNARTPLASYGGKTALDIARAGYAEHQSQQWCWFKVTDGYHDDGSIDLDNPFGVNLSNTQYGLYRTLVGADITGTSIMDNITPYDQQANAPAGADASADDEGTAGEAADANVQSAAGSAGAVENVSAEAAVRDSGSRTTVPGGKHTTILTILIILAIILAAIIVVVFLVARNNAKIRAKERQFAKENGIRARNSGRRKVNRTTGNRSASGNARTRSAASAAAARSSSANNRTGTTTSRNSSQNLRTPAPGGQSRSYGYRTDSTAAGSGRSSQSGGRSANRSTGMRSGYRNQDK